MRNLYRRPPKPGKGRLHPAKRGGVGWQTRKQNDEADSGAGYLFVLTGVSAGRISDKRQTTNSDKRQIATRTVIGMTRNHPSIRAGQVMKRGNSPELWACLTVDRKRDHRLVHDKLVEWSLAHDDQFPDLATILQAMGEVTRETPSRFPLIPPDSDKRQINTNVAHITC